MAEILLTVGVDTATSYSDFVDSINKMAQGIRPVVRVDFEIDQAAMNKLRQEINATLASIGQSGNGYSAASYMQGIANEAQAVNAQISAITSNLNTVDAALRTVNTTSQANINSIQTLRAATNNLTAATQRRVTTEQAAGAASTQSANAGTTSTHRYQAELDKVSRLLARVIGYQNKWTAAQNGASSVQYRMLGAYRTELETLQSEFANNAIPADFDNRFRTISSGVNTMSAQIRSAGENVQSLRNRFTSLTQSLGTWFGAMQVILYGVRIIRNMVEASRELEDAFTQLKIVTGATNSQMKEFVNTATDLSKQLGKSVSDLASSIETFSRLGYNLSDASELAKYASILSNVAAVSTEDATTGITSIIKGYNLDVSQTEHVADLLVEVGQKYAVSASEMMEAFEKSGAALNATNTSIEKSAGLIAAANASVQNASTVGTALKTVSARIRGSKTDLEELGEDTEELADGFSKYAKEMKALTGFDIMVDGTTDQFKDIYDIFEGVSGAWDDLSDTQQARVAEILGGTRQLQVISSIIGNWEDATNAYSTAMNSAGAATKANDIYMETASAHIQQFQASFQELSSNLISSGFITGVVTLGRALVELINALTKIHALLPLITASIVAIKALRSAKALEASTAAVSALAGQIIAEKGVTDVLAASVANLTLKEKQLLATRIQDAVASKQLSADEAKQILSTLGLTAAEGGLTVANKALGASFKSMMASIPVWGWVALGVSAVLDVIMGITSAVGNATDEISEMTDKADEAKNSIQSITDKLNENAKTVEDISLRFATLAQRVGDLGKSTQNKGTLSLDEYNEFLDLSNQLAGIFPTLTTGYDENGNAILNLSGSVNTVVQSLDDLLDREKQLANHKIMEHFPDVYQGFANNIKSAKQQIQKSTEDLEKFNRYYQMWQDHGKASMTFDVNGDAETTNRSGNTVGVNLNDFVDMTSALGIEIKGEMNEDQTATVSVVGDAEAQIASYLGRIRGDLEYAKQQFESELSSIGTYINTWLQGEWMYTQINDKGIQSAVQQMLLSFDPSMLPSDINADDWNAVSEWIRQNILFAIKNIDNSDVLAAIAALFNDDSFTLGEVNSYIEAIKEYFSEDNPVYLFIKPKIDELDTANQYANAVKNVLQDQFDNKVGELSLKDLEIAARLEIPEGTLLSWDELVAKIRESKDRLKEAEAAAMSFTARLNEVINLSSGFDELDKLYKDILDAGDFDWGSLLDNEAFNTAFSGLGDAYDSFIRVVANSPTDIAACQAAFDNLAGAYILNSDILNTVTDETRNATVAMLEQMGVANAAAIVDQQLAYNKEYLKYTTGEFADMTYEEIMALYNECTAGSAAQQVLAELALAKLQTNENAIRTSGDVAQLIALANTANASTASLKRLAEAKAAMSLAEAYEAQKNEAIAKGGDVRGPMALGAQESYYRNLAKRIASEPLEYEPIMAAQVSYTGGATTQTYKNNQQKSANSAAEKASRESEPKVIDWIKIAIDRIERAIDRLATIAKSPFRTLTERIGATNDELSKMSNEMSIQQSAYNRYIQQANSIGLSSGLAARVRDGAIDITKYDADTAEKIDEYQDLYEKALDCQDAILKLGEDIAELYQNKFEDIAEDYENRLSLLEHLTNTYNNGIDDLEERGYLASTKYYEALRAVEQQNIDINKQELADLTKQMSEAINSGSIKEGSEAWYAFQQKLNDVTEAIQESEMAMVEFANTIREIQWDRFDYLQEQIGNIGEEADFLIDLMERSDLYTDNGQLTDTGMATMGLRGQNYNVYMAQADKYAEELLRLNKEIADDPNNTKLLERREELLEAQRDAILAAEDEKEAIVDLVREGIELELDALKELIDKYTESLDSAKDLYDYQKKIKDQTSEIASLQKQISAYAGDTSEENRATVQKLQVDLSDAMEELEQTQYDHYISEQKALLDNLYDEYEMILNERLDNIDALLSDMIDTINANSSSICDTLLREADNVGYTITENERAIWSNEGTAFSIITKYGESFLTQMTTVNDVIAKIAIKIGAMVNASEQKASATTTTKTSTTTTPKQPTPTPQPQQSQPAQKSISVGGKINAGSALIYDYAGDQSGERQYYGKDPIYTVLRESNGWLQVRYHKLKSGITGWFKKSDVKAYKNGGLVDYTGLMQVDGTRQSPEMVLNSRDTANFISLKDALNDIAGGKGPLAQIFGGDGENILKKLASIDSPRLTGNVKDGDVTCYITIPIERVQDYNDFVNQLRQDGRFEKMIQSMTVDRLVGGSKIAKNKYQW